VFLFDAVSILAQAHVERGSKGIRAIVLAYLVECTMSRSPNLVLRSAGASKKQQASCTATGNRATSSGHGSDAAVHGIKIASNALSGVSAFLRKINCFGPRTVLPLYARSRTLLEELLEELNVDRTWQLFCLSPDICYGIMQEVTYSLKKLIRPWVPDSAKFRLILALALPLPFVISYRSLDYVLRANETLWQELAESYDLDSNSRYSVSELKGIFNWSYHHEAHCMNGHSICISHEHVSKWVEEVDHEQDGVDREELLDMFQQMPKPFMPTHLVDHMQRLIRITWYLKLVQMLFIALAILLGALCIRWLYNEVQLRRLLSWSLARDARRRQGYERKANEAQREIEQTRDRLLRAHRELARLSDERRRAEKEQRSAEAELQDRESMLRALVDPMGEQEKPSSSRQVSFLYASPLMILSKAGVPVLVEALRIDDEYELLRGALASGGPPDLKVDLATPQRLVELVLSNSPGLCLHVSCHGSEDCLYLENQIGCMAPLPVALARQWLCKTPICIAPEVVVLLCCSSENFGRVLLEAGVQHVVCTRGKLADRVAREFSQAFWSGMANAETSVEEAFDRAIVLLRAHDSGAAHEAGLLVLIPPSSLESAHSAPSVLKGRSSKKISRGDSILQMLELPHLSTSMEDFLGREFLLCNLLNCFVDGRKPRRVVCVHGAPGIGKTSFVSFLARFVHARGRLFSHGVLYDPSWSSRSESMLWLWLEAAWRMMGQDAWEREAAGLQPNSPVRDLLQGLCADLQSDQSQRRLLIVDDADRKDESILDAALGELLGSTSLCIIITARSPWRKDIHGFKVLNLHLEKLDGLSAAKLFLRRVRRPLRRADFEMFESSGDTICALGSATSEDWQSHVHAFLQHPLHQTLDGHPGRIRKTAEKVTDDLPSLYDICKRTMDIEASSAVVSDTKKTECSYSIVLYFFDASSCCRCSRTYSFPGH